MTDKTTAGALTIADIGRRVGYRYDDMANEIRVESIEQVEHDGVTYVRLAPGHEVRPPMVLTLLPDDRVTEPGLYPDMDEDTYHADPLRLTGGSSLSYSRAKVLLDEAGPARFKYREAVPPRKKEFDLGSAAHAMVLGKGAEQLVVIDADSWRTKAAQQARDAVYAENKTPLLPADMRKAEAMAEQVAKHQRATEALAGEHEVAMFMQHDDLWLRGKIDVLNLGSHIADYKSAADASAKGFQRAAWNFRYYMQAAWYVGMVRELTGETLPFLNVVQEAAAPYLVSVWEVDDTYLDIGHRHVADAIAIYRACVATSDWPGYPDEIQTLTPPPWARTQDESLDPAIEAAFAELLGESA